MSETEAQRIKRFTRALWDGKPPRALYQPLEHPAFADWSTLQPCTERLAMIERELGDVIGTLLDLGCHTGWFCRAFARKGWFTVGVDRSAPWIEIARWMNEDCPEPIPSYHVADVLDSEIPYCDVALCLSLAMYVMDGSKAGWRFLRNVSAKAPIMFFDFGGQYAKRMCFSEADATAAVLRHTSYNHAKLLGRTDFESRPLYAFRW